VTQVIPHHQHTSVENITRIHQNVLRSPRIFFELLASSLTTVEIVLHDYILSPNLLENWALEKVPVCFAEGQEAKVVIELTDERVTVLPTSILSGLKA
jgi:hypothetical protein